MSKKIYADQLISYLDSHWKLEELGCWQIKELSHELFKINLNTLSRYFNLHIELIKLELGDNGHVKTTDTFCLKEVLDLIQNVRKHFDPTLSKSNIAIYFDALTPEAQKKYEIEHVKDLHEKYDLVEHLAIESARKKLKH